MFWQLALFCFLLGFLYYVSRRLITRLHGISVALVQNQKAAIWILAFIFLPGTIVHELSHFLLATLFRVPTGHISIFPNFKHIEKGKQDISMGHIQIAQTGPFRHTLIGIAPLFVGLSLLYFIAHLFFPNNLQQMTNDQLLMTALGAYFLFSISLTMFTSRSDLRSFIFVAPVVILLTIALFLAGIRISVTRSLSETLGGIIQRLNFSLAVSAVIDAAILLLMR